jgi:ABC-type nitrate/sulfonate/bicarbonate transport system substrate-binding protein
MPVRVAIPDMVSPSYFPAIAAVELGLLRKEGLDASIELLFPVTKTYEALRDGDIDFVGGAAHAALYAFRDWKGCRLLCALSQHMYWFLVVRSDLRAKRGDLSVLKGLRIGAAPGPADGLKRMLVNRHRPEREVRIAPQQGAISPARPLDGGGEGARRRNGGRLLRNGMGEVALRRGVGTLVIDARRGDGPKGCRYYTFPAVVTTERKIEERPDEVAAAMRAIVSAQGALKDDPSIAVRAAKRHFPAEELALIAELVRRDAEFYDPQVSISAVDSLNAFARATGLLASGIAYEQVVATQFQSLLRR